MERTLPYANYPISAFQQYTQMLIFLLQNDHLNRVQRTAPLPEAAQSSGGEYSIGGSSGPNKTGSGKGGHEPKTLGDKKGLGAHQA